MSTDESQKDFLKKDLEEQREEMEIYKWLESEKQGRDVGKTAYLEWVVKYAKEWRDNHPFPRK